MNMLLKIIVSIAGGLAALAAIGWLGLQIPSRIAAPVTEKSQALGGVRIPDNTSRIFPTIGSMASPALS